MDLKSILAEDIPRSASSQPGTPAPILSAPQKHIQRTQSGPAVTIGSSRHNASPLSQSMIPPNLPAHVMSPRSQPLSSPLISPVPNSSGAPHMARTSSATSMDALADLASMHSHQSKRPTPLAAHSYESILSPDSRSRLPISQASLTSNPRASFDINMMDTPKPTGRTDFARTTLSPQQQERLGQLATYLQENPAAYESHVELINILHNGFIEYIYPSASPNSRRDPRSYDLLNELRDARDNMSKLFAVGESLWVDWLQDESMLAQTAEERTSVVEKCRKAVEEEVGSVKLWSILADWVLHCYSWSAEVTDNHAAPDEEKLVGKEIFTWQLVLDTWEEAIQQTAHDLSNSHIIWNKWLGVRLQNMDLQQKLPSDEANLCMQLFSQRLRTPHAKWDETFQSFSSFVSANLPAEQYEDVMSDTSRAATTAKKLWASREEFEFAIDSAQAKEDRDAEHDAFTKYIEWEQNPEKRRRPELELTNALYQRAELRFPSDTNLWEEHAAFLLQQGKLDALALLERATKHCPWSGSLYSQYLLTSDRLNRAFDETEGIKHKATSTGILEAAGIEEVLKVNSAWCSYLRRRAFRVDRDEDDADIAEIGIRASLESVSSLSAKLGLGETPDPSFRLQRIHINFLSESGRWDNARQEFDNAIRDYGKSWEFWIRFYNWEMMRWRTFAAKDGESQPLTAASLPHLATAVLKQALDQPDLDYPEPIIQALISHCEDFEDADELQAALLKVRTIQKALSTRREMEATQNAEAVPVAQPDSTASQAIDGDHVHGAKRKYDNEGDQQEGSSKKPRNGDVAIQSVEQTQADDVKRNRENATVLVENLPENVTETQIRQYFSSCGVVKALKILDDGASATVEFDDDDAARYALSRDGQEMDGEILSVVLDTGSTVFMTNYPPAADEAYLRDLLEKYGEIISVRFPSLQGNKNRRFCYVQFRLPAEAQNAVAGLDGKEVDQLQLVCKISNPAVKKQRENQHVNDGRTIFVGRLNFKASESDVRQAFARYGNIELLRMPLHETMKTRNKGIAFVTFSNVEEAQAALVMNGQMIKDMAIKAEIATDNQNNPGRKGSQVNGQTKSSTPLRTNGDRATRSISPGTKSHASMSDVQFSKADTVDRRERTVFLTQIPDTVNEARLQSHASKFGEILKCILKTNHQGALIEYASPGQAGQASLGLDGLEIEAGRYIKVVTEEEMKMQKPEKKADGFAPKPKPKAKAPPAVAGFIKRPTQPGSRPRKGGNLGQRSAVLHSSTTEQTSNNVSTVQKSNDDFRALITGGKAKEDAKQDS